VSSESVYDGQDQWHPQSPQEALAGIGQEVRRNFDAALLRCRLMQDLVSLLQQCEDDTRRLLGNGAAQKLGNWRRYASSETALIEYVQRLLWGEHCVNGRKLDQQVGLSLERIVLDHVPALFTEPDRKQAQRTLGI
jgi:hypothetical protein